MDITSILLNLWEQSGFAALEWQNLAMIGVAIFFMVLAVKFKYEPLLLVPIAFGILLANLPGANIMLDTTGGLLGSFGQAAVEGAHWYDSGVLRILYVGVKSSIFPCLIFMGVGAMTDFGPLLSNPVSLLLGAAAQLGVYFAFVVAIMLGFDAKEAASIAIIGGADGPTAIFLTSKLASHLLAPIALAAYSYMALIPIIQPPIMKVLTTDKERKVEMKQFKPVSKTTKIIFPVAVLIICALLLPSVAPLLGMLMLGNLFKECGVTDRLSDTAQNALMNIVTIMLGVCVGATANGKDFLTKGKINPLIGAAGVSAVPMAARVAQDEGRKYNPTNFLLMHAMGPNVAGVIGSAVAAGFLLACFG